MQTICNCSGSLLDLLGTFSELRDRLNIDKFSELHNDYNVKFKVYRVDGVLRTWGAGVAYTYIDRGERGMS